MCLNVPQSPDDWQRFSFANYDALNQINGAIAAQKGVTLPQYQVQPIPFDAIGTWLENNQMAHEDFNAVLGLPGSDLLHTDLSDPNQRQAWIYLNFMELLAACQKLGIGP